MRFIAETEMGQRPVQVTEIKDDTVVVDGNHPLAGQALTFNVKVVDVREATAEEVAHGHIHAHGGSCGGGGLGGGCCGSTIGGDGLGGGGGGIAGGCMGSQTQWHFTNGWHPSISGLSPSSWSAIVKMLRTK